MVELILMRHGQTDWNVARRYQGQIDTLLNTTGVAQMQRVAQGLVYEPIDRVVSSPLRRAMSSAEILANPKALPISPEPALMELDLGAWQGESYGLKRGVDNWFYDAPHGGETGAAFCARLGDWLANVQNGMTLVVAHGLVVQVLLMLACGGIFEDWHAKPIQNGAITKLQKLDAEWTLQQFNDLGSI